MKLMSVSASFTRQRPSQIPSRDTTCLSSVGLQSERKPDPATALSSLKNDCSLFFRMYIASQMRDGDLDDFFEHEKQACPPSLSQLGKLRTGTKSDLVGCLEDLVPAQEDAPNTGVQVLDGVAIVNILLPGAAKTFSDYAKYVFSPYITSQLQHVNRVDVVWDEYFPESLKA